MILHDSYKSEISVTTAQGVAFTQGKKTRKPLYPENGPFELSLSSDDWIVHNGEFSKWNEFQDSSGFKVTKKMAVRDEIIEISIISSLAWIFCEEKIGNNKVF